MHLPVCWDEPTADVSMEPVELKVLIGMIHLIFSNPSVAGIADVAVITAYILDIGHLRVKENFESL